MQETVYRFNTPYSIALITDVHNKDCKTIVASLANKKPDIIAIAGDLVYGNVNDSNSSLFAKQKNAEFLLKECSALAPTYMSLGNHEWALGEADVRLIKEYGVKLLDNKWIRFRDISIGGFTSDRVIEQKYNLRKKNNQQCFGITSSMDDFFRQVDDSGKAPDKLYTDWMNPIPEGFKIMLCHHPEYYESIPRDVDLILAGHAHGGQVRIFNCGIYAHGQGIFPKYTSGIYHGRMIVSRGLSNTSVVPRLFNPTEIVYIYPKCFYDH